MQKWEYLIVDSHEVPNQGLIKKKNRKVLQDYLNQLGEEGWEFIKIDFTDGIGISFIGVAKKEKSEIKCQTRRNNLYRLK